VVIFQDSPIHPPLGDIKILSGWFGPPFLAPEGSSTLKNPGGAAIRSGESHSHQEAIHKLEREEGDLRRGIDHLEGSTHKWRRRKTPSEG
jgi:hypothetical protein